MLTRGSMKLSVTQKKVLHYLSLHFPKAMSATSIGEEINGQGAKWAAPVCSKLVNQKLVDKNELGHFRINDTGVTILRESK
jgi:hypothetical protein